MRRHILLRLQIVVSQANLCFESGTETATHEISCFTTRSDLTRQITK